MLVAPLAIGAFAATAMVTAIGAYFSSSSEPAPGKARGLPKSPYSSASSALIHISSPSKHSNDGIKSSSPSVTASTSSQASETKKYVPDPPLPFEFRCDTSPLRCTKDGRIIYIESDTMEFKRGGVPQVRHWKKQIGRYICAFLNSYGGTLLIGIEDDGTVCGVDWDRSFLDELQLALASALQYEMWPKVDPSYIRLQTIPLLNYKYVLAIFVACLHHSDRRVFYFNRDGEYQPFCRSLASNHVLDSKTCADRSTYGRPKYTGNYHEILPTNPSKSYLEASKHASSQPSQPARSASPTTPKKAQSTQSNAPRAQNPQPKQSSKAPPVQRSRSKSSSPSKASSSSSAPATTGKPSRRSRAAQRNGSTASQPRAAKRAASAPKSTTPAKR